MKIVRTSNLKGTAREVKCPKGDFTSYRILLERDGMGFALTETHIPKGTKAYWHYKNHLEACYCVSGEALLVDEKNIVEYRLKPGTTYALDNHDPHTFIALEDVVLICVFNPPLTGNEIHQKDGSYVASV